jgi:CheY-like chemotaxis protein
LVDVLIEAIETSRPAIEQSRHRLDFVQPSEPLPLDGDGVRLAQVFSNLLNNAAKYTDPGGHLEVAVGRVDGSAVVTVRDNGIGIAADQLPRVFEMFAQIDASASRSHGGLGIGLALARKLVEMHGGRVEAMSDGPGAGRTFTVRLPLGGSGKAAPDAARTAPVLHARRVLVVDDNQDAADSLGMLLRFLGAEVRVEYRGADALTAVAAWRPSIVLLDLGMPGMDGFEVARRLRADPQASGLKLIALTGWGQDHDRLRSRRQGFDNHLIKPVDINVLLALLTSLEERRATN